MTFATPSMIVSGRPYRVVRVDGRSPTSMVELAAADRFTIDMDGTEYDVQGSGSVGADDEVRYHEKDMDNNGKDVRVWRLHRHEDGGFLAQHAAAF
jgi:hypothetical protein